MLVVVIMLPMGLVGAHIYRYSRQIKQDKANEKERSEAAETVNPIGDLGQATGRED
jgi:hypothetical protein